MARRVIKAVVLDVSSPIMRGKKNDWGWFGQRNIAVFSTEGSRALTFSEHGIESTKITYEELAAIALFTEPQFVLFVSDKEPSLQYARDALKFNVVGIHPAKNSELHWPEKFSADRVIGHIYFLYYAP